MKDRIKAIRKDKNLSQIEFGDLIGISGPAIAKIESGKNNPSDQTLKLICNAYKVSFAWLRDGIGPMYLPPDTDDELVTKVMTGENEFAKSVMRSFVKTAEEHPAFWMLLEKFIDNVQNDKKKADR